MLLSGMKVVSFCHFLQGPAAMQYLADMGADVIKIEPPQGAFERHWAGAGRARVGGVSALYLCANRGARSLALDLKQEPAREVVLRLLESRHVLAENFRPGTMERLGLGYEAVRQSKPDIIYASASGFGATGPFAGRPGQDLLVQAMSGLAASAARDSIPVAVGCAAADQHGAALLALGIVGAYARWLATGQGTRVETTLLGAALDLQNESIVAYHAHGAGQRAMVRNPHLADWFHEAPYGIYRTRDRYVAISLNQIGIIAESLGSEELTRFVSSDPYRERDAIARALARELEGWTFEALAAAFDQKGIWYARVDDFDEVAENPQVRHNEVFHDVQVNGETVRLLSHPLRYDGRVPDAGLMALQPGADTRAVLAEAGYHEDEIERLLRDRVAFAPPLA